MMVYKGLVCLGRELRVNNDFGYYDGVLGRGSDESDGNYSNRKESNLDF